VNLAPASIRANTRPTGASKNTVTRLLIDAGYACGEYSTKSCPRSTIPVLAVHPKAAVLVLPSFLLKAVAIELQGAAVLCNGSHDVLRYAAGDICLNFERDLH
jgi:hypothetical protein